MTIARRLGIDVTHVYRCPASQSSGLMRSEFADEFYVIYIIWE